MEYFLIAPVKKPAAFDTVLAAMHAAVIRCIRRACAADAPSWNGPTQRTPRSFATGPDGVMRRTM
jgi:hypothetical protein